MVTKQNLRVEAKKIRRNLDAAKMSAKILDKILALKQYQHAKNIMLFYPKEFEIDLRELLKDSSKQFFLPKIEGKKLLVCPYSLGAELILSEFKTLEPTSQPTDTDLDIIIVPAIMADNQNYRLGYGGGFYDRFLKNQTALTIVPIPSELIIDTLPIEDFDQKIDLVINEL